MTQLPLASTPRVLRLVVAYDGTDFHGFAEQRDVRTVAGELRRVIEPVVGAPFEMTCAGRTDAGVHAWGQVVSVPLPDAARDIDAASVRRAVSARLGPEVVVRDAVVLDATFDARHDARWRSYRYTIVARPEPDPFRARHAWWVAGDLDLARLRLAADPFLGEHDFSSFCRKGPPGSSTVRRVLDSHWVDEGDGILRYEVRATAFCWQMVRAIVGTIVDAGLGRIRAGDVLGILRAGDRQAAGQVAPPHGLCLWEVGY